MNMVGEDINELAMNEAISETVKGWEDFKMVDYILVPSEHVNLACENVQDPALTESK